jgi:hypothetical protein
MDFGIETINTKGCKILLHVFQFVSLSRQNGIPNNNKNNNIIIITTKIEKLNSVLSITTNEDI